jgi:precorrin-6x reductase
MCKRGEIDEPVAINNLKRHNSDWVRQKRKEEGFKGESLYRTDTGYHIFIHAPEEIEKILSPIGLQDLAPLEEASQAIRDLVRQTPMPKKIEVTTTAIIGLRGSLIFFLREILGRKTPRRRVG